MAKTDRRRNKDDWHPESWRAWSLSPPPIDDHGQFSSPTELKVLRRILQLAIIENSPAHPLFNLMRDTARMDRERVTPAGVLSAAKRRRWMTAITPQALEVARFAQRVASTAIKYSKYVGKKVVKLANAPRVLYASLCSKLERALATKNEIEFRAISLELHERRAMTVGIIDGNVVLSTDLSEGVEFSERPTRQIPPKAREARETCGYCSGRYGLCPLHRERPVREKQFTWAA